MTEGNFEGVEGVKIFTREWQPAGEPRGVVVISHGLNAHSGLYEWAAQQLTPRGSRSTRWIIVAAAAPRASDSS